MEDDWRAMTEGVENLRLVGSFALGMWQVHRVGRKELSVLGRGDDLWRDGVHPDAAGPQFDIESADQMRERCLGDTIGGIAGRGLKTGPGSDVDDRTGAFSLHMRYDGLRQPKCRPEVDTHKFIERRWRHA
jgi:hypothetical protein